MQVVWKSFNAHLETQHNFLRAKIYPSEELMWVDMGGPGALNDILLTMTSFHTVAEWKRQECAMFMR